MDSQKKRFSWPFILALALHLTILALFALSSLFNYTDTEKEAKPAQEIINATIVDETREQAESKPEATAQPEPAKPDEQLAEEKIKQQTEADLKAEQAKAAVEAEAAEAKKKTEAAAKAKQAELAKAKAEADAAEAAKKQAESAKAETAKAAKKQAEAEKAEAEAAKIKAEADEAAAKAKAVAEQAEALRAKTAAAQAEADKAKKAIKDKVNRSWIRPSDKTRLKCTIKVRLMSDGTVIDATVISSSGDELFDRSAENAVNKASPLPVPKDKNMFAKEFRSFQFVFEPK